jgi:hypothetical protein
MSTDDKDQMRSFTSGKLAWMNAVSIDPELKPHDFQVAFVIAQCISFDRQSGTIADDTIAESTGTSRRHVLASRNRLRERRWLTWDNTRTSNLYRLIGDRIDAMADLRIDLRDKRAQARLNRVPSRRAVKQVSQPEALTVQQSSQHDVKPIAQHAVNQSAHIHHHCSTNIIHQGGEHPTSEVEIVRTVEETEQEQNEKPSSADRPLPAIQHQPLAEMRLFDELGEGDPERGLTIATRIGNARFDHLLRQLTQGTLMPSTVKAARESIGL